MMKNITLFPVGILLAAFLTGCGSRHPDGLPPLQPLTLTVTQEGKPLSDATVFLYPADGSRSWNSGGLTESDGSLVVFTTYGGQHSGAPAGKYKVTVDCVTSDPPPPKEMTLPQYEEHNRKYPPFRIVPLQYTDQGTTPLEIEVVKGANQLSIDIPEKVKLKI